MEELQCSTLFSMKNETQQFALGAKDLTGRGLNSNVMTHGDSVEIINRLFETLDSWRHLPNYQLERRADIFFAMYLKDVLEQKYGTVLKPVIIPEFPIRVGVIYEETDSNKSFKIDYVLFSQDGKLAYLVELKTDDKSRKNAQDKYLELASKAGMPALLNGIVDIYYASSRKNKYRHLLALLQAAAQIEISANTENRDLARSDIQVTSEVAGAPKIVYVQPNGAGEGCINFAEFADFVESLSSPISARFASSLREWAKQEAGSLNHNNSLQARQP